MKEVPVTDYADEHLPLLPAKVQLKLSVQRVKMLHEKKEAMAKKSRREIAALIEKGKLETARIKTEGIIADDVHVELLELLELYSEMLLARFALLDLPSREPDPSLVEPLCALIHASPRTELRELHALREMLMSKYGRSFAENAMENKDNCVGDRTISKLKIETPSKELVDMYIFEICKAYDVAFTSPYLSKEEDALASSVPERAQSPDSLAVDASLSAPANEKESTKGSTEKNDTSGKESEKAKESSTKTNKESAQDEVTSLEARFAALKRK